jgi:hypothetical protein
VTGEDIHQLVLSRLEGVRGSGTIRSARCPVPAHNDHKPSLRVFLNENGSVGFRCHAGCPRESILEAIGLTIEQTRPSEHRPRPPRRPLRRHTYDDSDGNAVAVKLRWKGRGAPYTWQLPDGTDGLHRLDPGLYHRPAVEAALRASETVWLAEGEHDADTLTAAGLTATTGPHGAGKWKPTYTAVLAGATVVVVADRDRVGIGHAKTVAAELSEAGCTVSVLVPPAIANDVSELIQAGGSLGDLEALTDDIDIDVPGIRMTKDGRPAFAQIPGHWADLLDPHCLQLVVLLDCEQGNAGKPMEGRNKLSSRLAWSHTMLDRHIGHLSEKGIVSIGQQGRNKAVYRVINPSRARTVERTSGTAGVPTTGTVRGTTQPRPVVPLESPQCSYTGLRKFSGGSGKDEREGEDPVAGAFPGAVEIGGDEP